MDRSVKKNLAAHLAKGMRISGLEANLREKQAEFERVQLLMKNSMAEIELLQNKVKQLEIELIPTRLANRVSKEMSSEQL